MGKHRAGRRLGATAGLVIAAWLAATAPAAARDVEATAWGSRAFQIDFDEAMQTWANTPSSKWVQLEPARETSCHWSSDTRLSCVLTQDLPAATRIRARIAGGLTTQTGRTLRGRTLTFETDRPSVGVRVESWGNGLPSIALYPGRDVTAEALRAVLRLELDGRPIPLPPLRYRPASTYQGPSFVLDQGVWQGRSGRLVLRVRPGLRSTAGPLRGKGKEEPVAVMLQPAFALAGVSCIGAAAPLEVRVDAGAVEASCVPGLDVRLHFTRLLDKASRERVVAALAPSSESSAQKPRWENRPSPFAEEDTHYPPADTLVLDGLPPLADVRRVLDGAVRSAHGDTLQPVALRLRTGEAPPQLRARHTRAVVANGTVPPTGIEAINAGRVELQLERLDREHAREPWQADTPRAGNVPIALRTATAERTLAAGGWVSWQLPTASGQVPDEQPVEFAAPRFDLSALPGRREILVWANEWERDTAVAGAQVELLWRETPESSPRVAATALTDADGVALLRLPDDLVADPAHAEDYGWKGPDWLVRAARGANDDAGLAVLPLGRSDMNFDLGRAAGPRIWGVSDRPLYRAGETVRYQLWLRTLEHGLLRTPARAVPVTLRLQNDDRETAIEEWQATPGPEGLLDGELRLPQHLGDGTYCIGMTRARRQSVEGTCFHVGSHQAQDLWAEVESPTRVLLDGERFTTQVRAGYFSGGPAAGLEIDDLSVHLYPLPLSEAYPTYDDYTFIDVWSWEISDPKLQPPEVKLQLDAEGRQRVEWTVAFAGNEKVVASRAAFGVLEVEATVSPSERDSTSALSEATRYARHPRYVGLKATPNWFDADDEVRLEAVVISARGERVRDPAVEVTIEYLAGFDPKEKAQTIATCTLRADAATPCPFARDQPGRYRLVARSDDAAPATLERYVGAWSHRDGEDFESELEITHDGRYDADPHLRLQLTQPYERARSLAVITVGGEVVTHRVLATESTVQELQLATDERARGWIDVNVYVRSSAPTKAVDGYRQPTELVSLSVRSEMDLERAGRPMPLTLAFAAPQTTPGTTLRLQVTNHSDRARDVALSVMDDALRAQAQRWLPYADPFGPLWLGGDAWDSQGAVEPIGFAQWLHEPAWLWVREQTAPRPLEVGARPVDAAAGSILAEVYEEAFDDEGSELERIEVTGSRIKRADIVEGVEQKAPTAGMRPREANRPSSSGSVGAAEIRLRRRFEDTALWVPRLRLAPGETRSFELAVPDNLTRWRALAWSSDDGGEFAMQEAELEVGLPLETRLQVPARLYPGDESRLAAHLRQQGDASAQAQVDLRVQDEAQLATLTLAPRGEASHARHVAPQEEGTLHVVATARTANGADGVTADVEVASPWIDARLVQAGWLGGQSLALDLPTLPTSAHDPRLHVSLLRGTTGFTEGWTRDLREYPHRCWEQILSRAVAAALALERGDVSWPDAGTAVEEALDNAAVFQAGNGSFVYFVEQAEAYGGGSVPLTAYSLRALELLRTLGHRVPDSLFVRARGYLHTASAWHPDSTRVRVTPERAEKLGELALAASGLDDADRRSLDWLWRQWQHLALPAQVATAQALTRQSHPHAVAAVRALLEAAPRRGAARRVRLERRYDDWMSSDLREQCALIELVQAHSAALPASSRNELLAGLGDLYAGGAPAVDTQSGAICLMALRADAAEAAAVTARVTHGARAQRLTLAADEKSTQWAAGAPQAGVLRIEPQDADVPLSYVAELHYVEDARTAPAQAVGFALTRRYAVLREGAWLAVGDAPLHEGDWLRITLELSTSAPRQFVALTDQVPGGLRPTDLTLSAVAGRSLERIAHEGSAAFETRRLDARQPRFYADSLPPGRHEVHYFARVGNAGDYLAAPALAELMYGKATRARTAGTRLHFEAR